MDIIDVYVQKQQQQQDNYNSFSINTINIIKGSKKKEEKRDALFNKKGFFCQIASITLCTINHYINTRTA